VVHVPAWDVTTYRAKIATATSAVLAGCVCARCGSSEFVLTGTWFVRFLGSGTLRGRRAVCTVCGHDERVLPCEAVPSKTCEIATVIDAFRLCVRDRKTVAFVARKHGVAPGTVRNWVRGLWARVVALHAQGRGSLHWTWHERSDGPSRVMAPPTRGRDVA